MSVSKVIIAVSVLATAFAIPSRAAEKLPAHPKLVYRQIGAGYTLALETGRKDKIMRDGGVISPGFIYCNTESKTYGSASNESALPSYLKNLPLSPSVVAWQKLSSTRALW